jgi:hypothetical protein
MREARAFCNVLLGPLIRFAKVAKPFTQYHEISAAQIVRACARSTLSLSPHVLD